MRHFTLCLLLALVVAVSPLRAQAPAADIQKIDGLLAASKYTATRITTNIRNPNAAVWRIPLKGESIGEFEIRVTAQSGMLITFVTVAAKKNIRRTADLVEKVLALNNDLDYVKVGFDNDSDAFVRVDAFLRTVDVQQMNDILQQVGNSADRLHATLKPSLIP